MKTVTKSLITLAALVGATAAFAGDQLRTRDQLKDASCIAPSADGTATDCLRLADQDLTRDRDQLKLNDGSCLDGDGVPDRDGDGAKVQTRTQARAGAGTGAPSQARKGK